MKSGTSSLFRYLSQHPELAVSPKKELHFFDNPSNFALGYDYYLDSWDWQADTHKYALESTPAYTRSTHPDKLNAAENIAQMQSDLDSKFKFIYIMRNPIERIESQYNHALVWGGEKTADPNEQLVDSEALDTSKYAMQIREYYQRFDSSDILLLNFEDLKSNPQQLLREVCLFLDIDPNYEFQFLDKVYNLRGARKVVKIPGWSKLKQNPLFVSLSNSTPLALKKAFRGIFKRKTSVKTDIKLSIAQRQYAEQELKSDLLELEERHQIDIKSWGFRY